MASDKFYMTIEEAEAITGMSEATVRRRVGDGSFASFQPGGPGTKILILRDSLFGHDASQDLIVPSPAAKSHQHQTPPPSAEQPSRPRAKWARFLDGAQSGVPQ